MGVRHDGHMEGEASRGLLCLGLGWFEPKMWGGSLQRSASVTLCHAHQHVEIEMTWYDMPVGAGQAGGQNFCRRVVYKEKGKPIGMKPDRLVVTAVDCDLLELFLFDISVSWHPFLMLLLSLDPVYSWSIFYVHLLTIYLDLHIQSIYIYVFICVQRIYIYI